MKTKSLLAVVLGFSILQACQNTEKKTQEIQSAVIDSALDKNVITDTTGINRGANLSVFMNEAALAGIAEIELGKIAQEKTANKKVKDFAKMMIKDHTKIAEKLNKLAIDKRMTLPTTLPREKTAHFAEMQKMQANDFDKHYIDMMVKDHIRTLDLFKAASTSGDTPLQNFAINSLRMLERHYKAAVNLDDHLQGRKTGASHSVY